MRWKLFSLSALLITATIAQKLTIETGILFVDQINETRSPNEHIQTSTEVTPTNSGTTAKNDVERHNSQEHNNEPYDSKSSSESSSSSETSQSPNSKEDSNDKSKSRESVDDTGTPSGSNERPGSSEMLSKESKEKPGGNSAASRSSQLNSNEKSAEEPSNTNDEHTVQTTHGPVKGSNWHENPDILAFIDIPYGKFTRYFDAPVTAQSWLDIHDVTEHTKRCPQLQNDDYIGDVNCLTLSIFTPINADNVSVLFHIHDGSSDIKSADPLVYGPDYLVPKGVILVLPNYRFGPMGFLCMQNETAPGNAGLKDLSLALEWIKENIHLFGGNPDNIVVSGDGAAGAYASYMALYSRSKYYINKVITESGSALSHWALDRDPIGTADTLAEKIRREHSNNKIYNNIFEEVSLEIIINTANGMTFNPCLEHDKESFMDDTPWKTLHKKEIDITFMIGSASYAGTREATETTASVVQQLNNDFGKLLPEDLIFKNDEEKQELAQILRKQYFGEDEISLSDIKELSLWYTDASYLGPALRLARPLTTAGATVYFYEFDFVGSLNRELESMNKPVPGAVRRDIVGYLFHNDGTAAEAGSPEELMIHLMVDLWVSFINTGKPRSENVQWNQFLTVDESEEEWLLINSQPTLKKGVHEDRLRRWTTLYNEHFIEGNSALRHKPPYCVAVMTALMCWLAGDKLNNKSG